MDITQILLYAFIFALGLVVGSFLNVCIYRIPLKKSISFPPSSCTNCGKKLSPLELIPVISYMLLRGRCRGCGAGISIKYPVVELLTGFLFIWVFSVLGFSTVFLKYAVLTCILLVVSFIDLEHQIIPDEIVIFSLAAGAVLNIMSRDVSLKSAGIGFFAASGILLLIAIITKGGMGGGDIKLMAAVGLFIGTGPVLLGLFLSFIIGGVISLILIILKLKGRKDYIPFGPFLSIGSLVSALFYNQIIYWYVMRL
ncbi:leader peptidase (prepilin peptidase) / N-methyltransferase [Peptoclostridium litorale DSM 5388]|uniref:Type 4 prepilin-like protein ComC n=1 Tax=Peptoclostridium litorale DSM 5388 TaxID=1121324 RepID=A0A069R9R8_PEPLI|nr:A24 family peptidase [Peptoclostridium litorale]KDR93814.1 type 4 prepilin-like protein ComC [Peptoclostridium litorale DSM 5388]SIN86354.1 leader peptidase (prepilin peptidase) / N-methyltransferase [Peptoclostridium litorale DSM 5388]